MPEPILQQNLPPKEKRLTELRQIVLDWIKPKKRERSPARPESVLPPKKGWGAHLKEWWQKLRQIFQK